MSIMCYLSSWCYHCLRARRFFDFVSCFFAIKQMDDQTHLKAFNHSFPELNTKRFDLKQAQPQEFDFFLVLDLEGKVEILEFPVLMIDAKTLKLVDFFHRLFIPVDNLFFFALLEISSTTWVYIFVRATLSHDSHVIISKCLPMLITISY